MTPNPNLRISSFDSQHEIIAVAPDGDIFHSNIRS
ncbi:hypothetical protein XHC_4476 [Xanthomonas hortorum pv. carotae str. M081]|nr:hypothetical protein XHC_4476 [Xanthomonas hortorum pv. carotae str. M081]